MEAALTVVEGNDRWLRAYDGWTRGGARQDRRNFAAGMSGGVAYVLDSAGTSRNRNAAMVELGAARREAEDRRSEASDQRHVELTAANWHARPPNFRRPCVRSSLAMPRDHKRAGTHRFAQPPPDEATFPS